MISDDLAIRKHVPRFLRQGFYFIPRDAGSGLSLSEEERWDLINFMRALSSGDRARSLAPVIEPEPWLVAPDFT